MTDYAATDREVLDDLLSGDWGVTDEEREILDRLDKQLRSGLSLGAQQRNKLDEIVRERTRVIPRRKESAMANKGMSEYTHEFQCKYGAVGTTTTGDHIGVSIQIERQHAKRADVDKLLCGSQLEVLLACDPNADGDADGQMLVFKDMGLTATGVAEVASYGCYPKRYNARLKFPREAIDLPMLSRFSGHRGILKCRRIGDAQTKAEAETEAAG